MGGKLTTYRSLAEECVDKVIGNKGSSRTAEVPLPGAVNLTGLNSCDRLLRVYGSRAKKVIELSEKFGGDTFTAEIVFAFEHEFARTLSDCFLRRTMIGLNADRGLGQLQAAADVGKRLLGWTDERAVHEVESFKTEIS